LILNKIPQNGPVPPVVFLSRIWWRKPCAKGLKTFLFPFVPKNQAPGAGFALFRRDILVWAKKPFNVRKKAKT
jgi:hypothetical protein